MIDFAAVAAAVDYSSVLTGIGAITLVLGGVAVGRYGAGTILSFIRRGR